MIRGNEMKIENEELSMKEKNDTVENTEEMEKMLQSGKISED